MSIALGALNNTAISQARTEKVPISGAGDPSTTILALTNAINGCNYIPIEYASASDQAATIAAAVTAATAGDTLFFGQGVVKVETQITIGKRLNIVCFGTNFTTSSNIAIFRFTTSSDLSTVWGATFTGSGEDSGSTTQTAINSTGSRGITVEKCYATAFGGPAFIIGNSAATAPYEESSWVSVKAMNCNLGFEITGEYIAMTNCFAVTSNNGWHINGGSNFQLLNCSGNGNEGYGIRFTNAGKGKVTNGNFNHNAGSGLDIVSLAEGGQRFIGTSIVANTSPAQVKNSNAAIGDMHFTNCHLEGGMAFDGTTALRVTLTSNSFSSATADSGLTTNVTYVNNYLSTGGTLYAG